MLTPVDNQVIQDFQNQLDNYGKNGTTKKEKQLTIDDIYKMQAEDINLVEEMYKKIESMIGAEEAEFFKRNKNIADAYKEPSLVQRVTISRWLVNALLKYRCYIEVKEMANIIHKIPKKGTHKDWMKSIVSYVLPYIKEHAVIRFAIEQQAVIQQAYRDVLSK